MSKNYKIGDKVAFVNAKESGIIIAIDRFRVTVINESGFELSTPIDNIVPVVDDAIYTFDVRKIGEKDLIKKHTSKPKINEVWEVDLHLSEIDTNRVITDHEKLLAQLKHFHRCMEAAINQKIKKVIFIHGVGKGTLKQEILHALKSYTKIRYYDAPYRQYGFGATVVEL